MMRGRALRLGPEGVTGLGQTGRTFSRTGCCDMATLKPMTPLQPLMQASMKPPSPMLTPEQQPLKPPSPLLAPNRGALKPASPLHPKNAPQTPISHPQRRWRFQLRLGRRPQRRRRFQTTGPAGLQGLAAAPVGGAGAWPGFETTHRAKLAARTASGRAAAHRHTQRPGPPTPATPVGPQATSSVL